MTESLNRTEELDEKCVGYNCCVFPFILATMLGAFLRQLFRYNRVNFFSGHPPYTVCLIVLGALFTLGAKHNSINSWDTYMKCSEIRGTYILHLALPLLTFQSTFNTEIQVFKKSLNQVLLIAVTGYGLTVTMTAAVVRLVLYPTLFNNIYICIILSIVVCATDPLTVDDAVKVSGVSESLAALLQGESIIGDAVAIVLHKLFLVLLVNKHVKKNMSEEITLYVVECMFAPVWGVFLAMATVFWLSRIFNDSTLEISIVLSVVHIAYYISELIQVPGILTVLFFGLYLSSSRASISHMVEATMRKFFRVMSDIFSSVVYFYAGVFLVRDRFEVSSIPMTIVLYIFVNLLRGIMVFFLSPILRRLGLGLSWQHTLTVWLGGLNGCFNILLAMMAADYLKIIEGTDIGLSFFQAALITVFLKQLLNCSIVRSMLRTFGLSSLTKFHKMSLANAMRILKVTRAHTINSLKSDRFMADAMFDIVESDTQVDEFFANFNQKRLSLTIFQKIPNSVANGSTTMVSEAEGSSASNKAESIIMLIKAQKKMYWRYFERGLMSKEALHQLIEWADAAVDHKGKFLDVKRVKESSQVKPMLKSLKRQVRFKLKQLQQQQKNAHGWQLWQQQVLPNIIGYGFHLVDTLMIVLAIVMEFSHKLEMEDKICTKINTAILAYNGTVVGIYGMVAMGEMFLFQRKLLVMRMRFFKILWHDIKLAVVVTGIVDLMVMTLVGRYEIRGELDQGHIYVRLSFILSRLVRLLGLIEVVPSILEMLLKFLEKRISGELGTGFDICCAYVNGQVEVSRQLESLMDEESVAYELKRHCNHSKLEIIKTLGILALEHPTIALSVKTRQAVRIVLNAQHDSVKQLKMEGALQDNDAALLMKGVEEKMKKVLNNPPLVEDNSEENIIHNMGWAQGDNLLVEFIQDNMEIWSLKPNAILTEQGQSDFNIYIIRSGVAKVERMTSAFNLHVVDFLTTGNVLGEINFLTKSPRHKTIRCETAVTVIALTEEVMEEALKRMWVPELPPLLYRMWLTIAKRIAFKIFMENPEHQTMGIESLRMLLYNAYLVDNRLGNSLPIHENSSDDVVLIHGHARDAYTREPFIGPCIIPRTCYNIELQPEEGLYTLLMIIPEHYVEDQDFKIDPTRRQSQIAAHLLTVSDSADMLRMEDELQKRLLLAHENIATPESGKTRLLPRWSSTQHKNSSESSSSIDGSATTLVNKIQEHEIVVSPPRKRRQSSDTQKLAPVIRDSSWRASDEFEGVTEDTGKSLNSKFKLERSSTDTN